MRPAHDDGGYVLVTAVLVLSILGVLCLGIAHWTRIQLAESAYRQAEFQSEHYLDNALAAALYLIQNKQHQRYLGSYRPLDDPRWFGESSPVTVQLMINDIGGRLSINDANRMFLEAAIKEVWKTDAGIKDVVDAIEDWRGTANNPRFNIAYGSKEPKYSARRAPFKRIEELLYVAGISPGLFFGDLGAYYPEHEEETSNPRLASESVAGERRLGLYDYFHAHPDTGLSLNGMLPHVWRVVIRAALFDHPGASEQVIRTILGFRFGSDGIPGTDDDQEIRSPEELLPHLDRYGILAAQRINAWTNLSQETRGFEIRALVSPTNASISKEAVALAIADGSGHFAIQRFAYVR